MMWHDLIRPWRVAVVAPALAMLVAAGAPAAAAPKASASAVTLEAEADVTRFVLELDRDIEFSVFALADPYRVIIDLQEVEFALPAGSGQKGTGLVGAYRFGLFSPGKSRIVIDATGPVALADPVIYKGDGEDPARLVIEMSATSREAFMNDFALNGEDRRSEAEVPPTMRAAIIPDLNRVENPRPVIVIDPGHGGVDPGAVGASGAREKDVVLEFANDLAAQLRESGAFEVLMTRDSDVFVRLDDRRALAKKHNADLFISVHADSIRLSGIRGATVYTVSDKASDQEAAELATHENRADLLAGIQLEEVSSEVGDILIELASRDTKIRSVEFAKILVGAMRSNVKLNSNPHRSAGFVVLKSADFPAVLIELGYLSNSQDESALRSSEWREKASSSMVSAVAAYFSQSGADTP